MPKESKIKKQVSEGSAKTPVPIEVEDSTLFEVNDTIMVPAVKVSNRGFLTLYVQKKTDEGNLVVIAINTENNVVPQIDAGAKVIRIGFAGSE